MFRPVEFILQPPRPKAILFTFANRPDDDVCLAVNGRIVLDPQRNLGWYGDFSWGYSGPLFVADRIEVSTFDGWGGAWVNYPWSVRIEYANQESLSFKGGENRTGNSIAANPGTNPNYYSDPPTFRAYYPNGSFRIPPPPSWPCPPELEFYNSYALASPTHAVKG
ncbi:MAG: hypothetical protein B9S32_13845 [Verrucomicrobia bacterium Tous-C9LFEB]|nr:MAG: hypothetical protein B9S32_13845 [Verrucomicrobia bacterium Tous-C9LFEB]